MLRGIARLEGGLLLTSYTPLVPGVTQPVIPRDLAREVQAGTVVLCKSRYSCIVANRSAPANRFGRDVTAGRRPSRSRDTRVAPSR